MSIANETTAAVVSKDEAAPVSPVAATHDDAKSSSSNTEVKELTASLRQILSRRRMLRSVQITYRRIKKGQFKYLKPVEVKPEETEQKVTKDPEEVAKEKVRAVYRLLRNFNFAVNVQTMTREDDKRVFPQKFAAEMESLFEDKQAQEKLKKALQASSKEEYLKEIPEKLSEKTLSNVAEFLEKHDSHVIDSLEALLKDLTKQVDEKRAKLNTLRPEKKASKSTPSTDKSKKSRASTKKSTTQSDQEEEPSAEEKFRLLIREVNQRVKAVKLKKDDFELYVKMQQEIDSFLHEAITEIKAIKTRFKKRFDDIQTGKGQSPAPSGRRNRSRSRRNNSKRRVSDPTRS